MSRFILFLCGLLGTICVLPSLVSASEGDVVVDTLLTLRTQTESYHYRSITVKPLGKLILEPGVTLVLEDTLKIEGQIVAQGQKERPIVIRGEEGKTWKSLIVTEQAFSPVFEYVQFKDFEGPLQFYAQAVTMKSVDVIDGVVNSLLIGDLGKTYGNVYLEHLRLLNYSRGSDMVESRITMLGNMGEVFLHHVSTYSGQQFGTIPWNTLGIVIPFGYGGLGLHDVSFPYGCRIKFSEFIAWQRVIVVPDVSTCKAPQIPTIFVPGYGTSINLSALTKNPFTLVPSQQGWRFLSYVTPAYTEFIQYYKDRNLPLEVAYFDWRLPADQIVSKYLIPVIESVKQRYNVPTVNIVAHSFGGIVSRSYLQGQQFHGDVATLTQLGTPNQGAAKAYGVWEAAELPSEWSIMNHLIRFYQYKFDHSLTPTGIIRKYFPSLQELMPIYPAIRREGIWLAPEEFQSPNATLLHLRTASPVPGIPFINYFSRSRPTLTTVAVGRRDFRRTLWPDGQLLPEQLPLEAGDGTVPAISGSAPNVELKEVSGLHADLPQVAAADLVNKLYPGASKPEVAPSLLERWRQSWLTFAFDCPVEVSIKLPDGQIRSSVVPDASAQIGLVEWTEDMLWMLLPRMAGTYEVSVKALANTPVRFWVDQGPIQEFSLKKDEVRVISAAATEDKLTLEPVEEVSPTPTASPSSPPQSLPEPSSSPSLMQLEEPAELLSFFLPGFYLEAGGYEHLAKTYDLPDLSESLTFAATTSLPLDGVEGSLEKNYKAILLGTVILIICSIAAWYFWRKP